MSMKSWRWHYHRIICITHVLGHIKQDLFGHRAFDALTNGCEINRIKYIRCNLCQYECISCMLTYRRVVAVWIRFVRSFTHERPLIVFEFAFNDFAIQITGFTCDFDFGKW